MIYSFILLIFSVYGLEEITPTNPSYLTSLFMFMHNYLAGTDSNIIDMDTNWYDLVFT